jgi:hypothetical protein
MLRVLAFGILAALIPFLLLRKNGSVLRHVIGYIAGAAATLLASGFYFSSLYPYATSAQNYQFWPPQLVAIFVFPIVGMVIAGLMRRRSA